MPLALEGMKLIVGNADFVKLAGYGVRAIHVRRHREKVGETIARIVWHNVVVSAVKHAYRNKFLHIDDVEVHHTAPLRNGSSHRRREISVLLETLAMQRPYSRLFKGQIT